MSGWALAQTQYSDTSKKVNADLSSGDLSTGATRNVIAGGNVSVDGMSEELAKEVMSTVKDAYTGATNFIKNAIENSETKSDARTEKTLATVTQSLKEAYNSEQATISGYKTYALYGVIAFIAWAYLRSK